MFFLKMQCKKKQNLMGNLILNVVMQSDPKVEIEKESNLMLSYHDGLKVKDVKDET